MNDRLTRNHYEMFGPDLKRDNNIICFLGVGARRPFAALASDKIADVALFIDGTQCLSLYRYTEDGERVSNITQWGIDRINGHYRREWGDDFESLTGQYGITSEEIFAYTYAVLHNPAYRHEYAMDLLREFPRLPLYRDFHHWAEMGQTAAGPAHRVRVRRAAPPGAPRPKRTLNRVSAAILRADKDPRGR